MTDKIDFEKYFVTRNYGFDCCAACRACKKEAQSEEEDYDA